MLTDSSQTPQPASALNVKQLVDEGRLRPVHLRIFLCCLVSLTFEGYDLVVYGATLPLLMREWNMTLAYAGFIASFGFAARKAAKSSSASKSIADKPPEAWPR